MKNMIPFTSLCYFQAEPDTFQLPQQSHVSDIRFLNNKVFVSYKHGVVNTNL